MKKFGLLSLVFVMLFFSLASVYAIESTSPLCTIEELNLQKEENSELYNACKENDGAFLCLHDMENKDLITSECRALSRVDEPTIKCEEGTFPVQNIDESGKLSDWFCSSFAFYEDPITLCTAEEYSMWSNYKDNVDTYNYAKEHDDVVYLCSTDIKDPTAKINLLRKIVQDISNPSKIVCPVGYPVQNYFVNNNFTTIWFCDNYTLQEEPTIFQEN